MSDSGSDDAAIGYNRHTLSDFPLSRRSLETASRDLQDLQVRLRQLDRMTRRLTRRTAATAVPFPYPDPDYMPPVHRGDAEIPGSLSDQLTRYHQAYNLSVRPGSGQAPTRLQDGNKEPRKPTVTVVSTLPPTSYKDKDDKTPKTLAFIKAQLSVLKCFDTIAADQLSPAMACRLTENIDSKNKEPSAAEALRLCYYMRSQGFDVYPAWENNTHMMKLYVVNQKSHQRGKGHDNIYWVQNTSTNQIAHEFAPAPRAHRRNAIPGHYFGGQGSLAALQQRMAADHQPHAGYQEGVEQPEDPRVGLQASIDQAEALLEVEVSRADYDSVTVQTMIENIESLREQMNQQEHEHEHEHAPDDVEDGLALDDGEGQVQDQEQPSLVDGW